MEAFLKAGDENQQRYILSHPEHILRSDLSDSEDEPYDARLSSFGNELMCLQEYLIQSLETILPKLEDHRMAMLNDTERVIISPYMNQVFRFICAFKIKLTHIKTSTSNTNFLISNGNMLGTIFTALSIISK